MELVDKYVIKTVKNYVTMVYKIGQKWAKKDKVNQPVRLLMQQQNGRITVGRWDLVTHAGTKWSKPRTVYTFYIKTNILTFFEKYKGNKNNQRHSHIYHKFTARTQKEHVDFTRLKPSSISI